MSRSPKSTGGAVAYTLVTVPAGSRRAASIFGMRCLRFRPMKTSEVGPAVRSSGSRVSRPATPLKSHHVSPSREPPSPSSQHGARPCRAASAAASSKLRGTTPLERYRSSGGAARISASRHARSALHPPGSLSGRAWKHSASSAMCASSPGLAGCTAPPSLLRQSAVSSPKTSAGSMVARSPRVGTLGASGTSSCRSSSTSSRRRSPASSTLLSRIRSVHFAWIFAVCVKLFMRAKLAQSTTVTTPSTRTMSHTFSISHTRGPGIADPLASTRMRWGLSSCKARRASASSPTLVQHKQPLTISRTSTRESCATTRSTPASPYSFLSHAQLYPSGSWRSSERMTVVLPAPRHPVSTVTGTTPGLSPAAKAPRPTEAATAARSDSSAGGASASRSSVSLPASEEASGDSDEPSRETSKSISSTERRTLVTVLPSADSCVSRPKFVPFV
mmetsp:Transcript_38697/g.121494  ORF Transcript_38697/g.121494 Transcript_38697/m.121494 type:complete len:446 (+) Transcript_38697:165-1502(+)